ncbi:hypothetical protein FQN57_001652 [Myotisia sp. PD_48]|nr:hypothetical protein FQN57_001652 [Myotisia sp. PD_48]
MSRIKELPDDFDESLDLNKDMPAAPPANLEASFAPSSETPFGIKEDGLKKKPTGAPDMPPAMASVKSHTADEILALMNQTPLFMTDADKALEDGEENIALEAIRALQNEGTRADVAQNYREYGNEHARAKQWNDAKEYYTKGITTILAKENIWEEPEDVDLEVKRRQQIEEACYINRALCNLELKNYRSTTLDCASTLKLNPKNVKAYYRSATALIALDKVIEAEDACRRGILLDGTNQPLQTLSRSISKRKEELEKISLRRLEEQERARKIRFTLSAALRARNIRTRETAQPPDLEDAVMKLSPDPLSPASMIVLPCVFLYPMDAQSDFIKEFPEMDTIAHHLGYILPLPWDKKAEYSIGSVECYIETANGGLVKAGKQVPLLKILSGGVIEIVDGMLNINILPATKSKAWIAEMKARKGA